MKWFQSRADVLKNTIGVVSVLLVTVIGVKLLTDSHAATGATLSATPRTSSVAPGSLLTIDIKVDSGTDPINAVQASLNYDAAQLQFVSISDSGIFPTVGPTQTDTPGIIRLARATSTPLTGSQLVTTLNFRVLASTGSIGVTFDRNFSNVVRSTDNADILAATVGATVTVSGSTSAASMYTSSPSTTISSGSTFNVTIRENSGSAMVNSVQASLKYDATKLQYVSVTEGGSFTVAAATDTSTSGTVRVARSVPGGSLGVSGDNPVVTISFKMLATSGTTAVSFDQAQSLVVESSTNKNILGVVSGTTYTVSSTSSGGGASMSLSPSGGTLTTGSTVSITVNATSLSKPLTAAEVTLNYPSSQLQFVSITEGNVFSTAQRTNTAVPGFIDVIRGLPGGSSGVTGTNAVVTLNFKVVGTSGTAAVTFNNTSALYDNTGSGLDIMDMALSTNGNYTIAGSSSKATLSLSPPSGTFPNGSTISVDVMVASGTTAVKSVQMVMSYPASQLQFLGTVDSTTFPTATRTNSLPGSLDIIRAVSGTTGASGTNKVVTLKFKVLGTSGTAAVNFTSGTAVLDSSNANIIDLAGSTNGTYGLSGGMGGSSGTLNMAPATGTYVQGSTISIAVSASSATAALTTVQATINYPASQLQFLNVTEGTVFTTAQRTNSSTAGVVDIIRSLPGGSSGVIGTNPVITVNFKVLGSSGSTAVTFGSTSALYDDSGTGTNILNLTGSTTASYTLTPSTTTCTAAPSTPGVPSKTASTYTTVTMGWTASTAGSGCTLGGYRVYRDGVKVGADITTGLSFADTGLLAGETHSYTVRAFDTAGNLSSASAPAVLSTRADDQSPTVPTSFTAVAPDAVSVNLQWSPSTDFPNPGGVGVAGYHVYRNGSASPTYDVTTGTSFTDSSVSPNTTYTYTVAAYDKVGNESAPSNIVSAKTATAPGTCTGSPTTPASLTGSSNGPTSIIIDWANSTPASGCTLMGYRVYRDGNLVATVNLPGFLNANLSPDTSYVYTVQAYDAAGHTSSMSAPLTVKTLADTQAPSAPSGVTATALSSSQVRVNWSASTDNVAVIGYNVYRGTTLIRTVDDTIRSFIDTTVTDNTDYTYKVSAIDSTGNESTKTTATPNPVHTPTSSDTIAPTAPSGLKTVSLSTTGVVLAWNASTDNIAVSAYHIYRGSTWIGDSSTLTYTDTGLSPNTAYQYTVKAYDAAGNTSSASSALNVTTLQQVICIVGDLDCDGVVDIFDLSMLLSHYQEVNVPVRFGDIDQDGIVNIFDLSALLSHYGDRA